MKNLALLLLASLNVFLYSHPRVQAPVEPVRPAAKAAAPEATVSRMYFHSPLDAPAMPTSSYTNMGYFSTDSSSVFRGGYNSATAVGPGADDTGGTVSKGASEWGDPSEAADIKALQGVYKLPRIGVPAPSISQ